MLSVESPLTETVAQPTGRVEAVESTHITMGNIEEIVTSQGSKDAAIYSFLAVKHRMDVLLHNTFMQTCKATSCYFAMLLVIKLC
jgi:hypothetical protein